MDEWKQGLPPGKVTPEMLRRYEVYLSPGGKVWYRLKPEPSAESQLEITDKGALLNAH